MTDQWTDKRDCTGESWNDLLQDKTKYARAWEKYSGPLARSNAQHWRDSRWQTLARLNRDRDA